MSDKDLTTPKKDGIIKTSVPPASKAEDRLEPSASSKETSQQQPMSTKDAFVSNLVKEAPKSVIEQARHRGPGMDLLALPEECKPLHKKKYRYRWLANDRYLEGKLNSSIWALCTRSNSPYIKDHRFKTHGAVEQAGMLLAFASEQAAQRREQEPAQKSADLVKHYTEDLPNAKNKEAGFYKPESAGSDDEEGFEEGRDFGNVSEEVEES
jgi:hypothetical protein